VLERFARIAVLLFVLTMSAAALGQEATLRPYDGLSFQSRDPRFCIWRAITPGGRVILPIVGSLNAVGLTLDQLRDGANKLLASRELTATVTVIRAFNPNAPLTVSGSCKFSGQVPRAPGRRVSYLIELAQPTDTADLTQIQFADALGARRTIDAASPSFAGSDADFELRPGDRMYFPQAKVSSVLFVVGGVKSPGSVTFAESMTVEQALAAAGGVSGHGDPSKVTVERGGKVLPGNPKLQRGDVIRVGLAEVRSFISVQGAVIMPGVVKFREGMTLTEVLDAAGGTTSKADLKRVRIKVVGGPERIVDVIAIRAKQAADVVLSASEIVDVPLLAAKPGDG